MRWIDFKGAVQFKKPKGWDDTTDGDCGTLPVVVTKIGTHNVFQSYWRPIPEELVKLSAGHCVVLTIYGFQPPLRIEVAGENPIKMNWDDGSTSLLHEVPIEGEAAAVVREPFKFRDEPRVMRYNADKQKAEPSYINDALVRDSLKHAALEIERMRTYIRELETQLGITS